MNIKNLLRTAATLVAAVLLALPAAAQQADFTTFVSIGDSLTMGIMDACLVEHGQRDSYPAIIARQASGAAFEQPLVSEHGLGGCMYLKSLLSATGALDPVFGAWPSDGVPLNATLARPYNNLGIDGFKIHDVVATNPTTPQASAAFLTLRGQGTALLQAASLKPTFMTIFIGANEFFGAIQSATVIRDHPEYTLTPIASVNADLDTIFNTLKAAQGGTGKGVVLNMGDPAGIPFVTTISPVIATWPAGTPNAGQPINAYSNVGCPAGVQACPVPPGSYLTLVAGQYLKAGYGVPCFLLDAAGYPANGPRRANCLVINPSTGAIISGKPLPSDCDLSGGAATCRANPGVVLIPEEIGAIRLEAQQINDALKAKAPAAGYKVFDMVEWFSDILSHGRSFGGLSVSGSYLGGVFSYDGAHLTSLGYAILANDLIEFINANYGNTIVQADMYPFLFNGNTSAGGYPLPPSPAPTVLAPGDEITWAAAYFSSEAWQEYLKFFFPVLPGHHAFSGHPPNAPISIGREVSGDGPDRVH